MRSTDLRSRNRWEPLALNLSERCDREHLVPLRPLHPPSQPKQHRDRSRSLNQGRLYDCCTRALRPQKHKFPLNDCATSEEMMKDYVKSWIARNSPDFC